MSYKSLNDFIKHLDAEGELVRIKEYVDPVLEITEIVDRVSKTHGGGKALLFENNGTAFPLLINAFGSEKRINMALGVSNLDDIGKELEDLFKQLSSPKQGLFDKLKMIPELGRIAAYMPKLVKGRGKSQEIIELEPDLNKFPILKCWPADGGRFITFPLVITKDPENGIRNVGMYRMQVFEKDLTAMHWHKHKVGARHFNEYKKLGKKMPIVVALGGDPALTYSATAPLPDNVDEFMLAGFLRKQKVKLVKAITQEIDVPADADIIIEGYVDPEEDFILEGPFGDHTGFYSLADDYPKFHVTCITYRKDAVYPTTIVGIPPQEDAWLGKATERVFLTPIRLSMLPELTDMDLPYYGVAHNLTIVSIKKDFAGHALKVMNALWGAGQMMFNKSLVVVEHDVDVHDYKQVVKAFVENVDPAHDIHFSMGPLDILDHSASKYAFGSKMCIDATKKLPEELYSIEKEDEIVPREIKFDKREIINRFQELININAIVIDNRAEIVFVSFKKSKPNHARFLSDEFGKTKEFSGTKLIVFFDEKVNIEDIPSAVWLVTNNIDPKRDCYFIENTDCNFVAIDGTRKTADNDKFDRDWPNIIVSEDKTIEKIDSIWPKLGLGAFIESPSKLYKPLVPNTGAILKNRN